MAEDKNTVEVDNRPTSTKDLERRLKEGFLPESARRDNTQDDVLNPEVVVAPYAGEQHDTSAYRGVDPIYMQYANESEKPVEPEEGPEAESLRLLSGGVAGVRKSEPVSNEPMKAVGVGGAETLATAVSGENYSAELVDAPKSTQIQTNGVALDMGQVKGESETTKTSPASPAPVKTTTTAKK